MVDIIVGYLLLVTAVAAISWDSRISVFRNVADAVCLVAAVYAVITLAVGGASLILRGVL